MGAASGQPTAFPSNPYQQAAGAQQQALATTGAATQYQTSPTAMGALSRGTSYGVNPAAAQGFQGAMNYTPQQVAATSYNAAQEAGPATAATAMQAYQNPYETQVVQQTLSDVARQAQIERQNMLGQYTGRKAFGSRRDVAEDTFAENLGKALTSAAAPLRQQGFQTALGAGQFDVGQRSASTARNVAAENVARQFGAQTGMTAQQLNQAAGLSGAQLNLAGTQALSGADLQAAQERRSSANALAQQALAAQQARTGAASQLANLGQQSFGYGTAIQGQQQRAGEMDRAIMQNLIGAGQQSFGQYTGAPTTGLQTLIGALTGVPQGQSQSFQPGLFNYMQLGANMFG
jgi:hypothetical protein